VCRGVKVGVGQGLGCRSGGCTNLPNPLWCDTGRDLPGFGDLCRLMGTGTHRYRYKSHFGYLLPVPSIC
jgi:hypothetical protein